MTYFWNGNRSGYFDEKLETFYKIESDKVCCSARCFCVFVVDVIDHAFFWFRVGQVVFNTAPAMKAAEITDAAIGALRSGKYDFVRINFPNGDMVGHTGDLKATIVAMEVIDKCLARLVKVVDEVHFAFFGEIMLYIK